MKKIRKIIKGYLKNITEATSEKFEEKAILNNNKLTFMKDSVKHTIFFKENEIILQRETNEFKNILTFVKNRSILSEYIIKDNNLSVYIEINTLELKYTKEYLYIKYKVIDSEFVYEYKIVMED